MKSKHIGFYFGRDRTINTDINFVRKPEELEFIRTSIEAIRAASARSLKALVITSQSRTSRGLPEPEELAVIHKRTVEPPKKRRTHIDAVPYHPHHLEYGKPSYSTTYESRKPAIGILRKAGSDYNLKLKKSFIVSDLRMDVNQEGKAGYATTFVPTDLE